MTRCLIRSRSSARTAQCQGVLPLLSFCRSVFLVTNSCAVPLRMARVSGVSPCASREKRLASRAISIRTDSKQFSVTATISGVLPEASWASVSAPIERRKSTTCASLRNTPTCKSVSPFASRTLTESLPKRVFSVSRSPRATISKRSTEA